MSPAGHTFQQEVPSLLLSEKSGTESRAVFGSGLWEPQPGGDFLKRNLWGLKYTRAHAPGGSGQLWWRGAGVGACRWRDRKGPRGGRKGSGLQSPQPSRTSPGSSPGLVIFKALGKAEAVRLQGRVGKMNQNSRKGNFLFCNTTNGTHAPGPPRSVCARKQKSRGSVGTCEPIATAELRQQARPRLCLLLACGSPPTACWQEEDIYSDLLFESLLGEKNHLISLHKQVLFYGTFV